MMCHVKIIFSMFLLCCLCAITLSQSPTIPSISPENSVHVRQKRSLLLKKKLLGAGILGLGLGVGIGALKGYKYGHYSKPHSYYAPTIIQRPTYYAEPYYFGRPVHYSYSSYGNYY